MLIDVLTPLIEPTCFGARGNLGAMPNFVFLEFSESGALAHRHWIAYEPSVCEARAKLRGVSASAVSTYPQSTNRGASYD